MILFTASEARLVGQRQQPVPQLLVGQPGRVVTSAMTWVSVHRSRPISSAAAP